MPTLNIKIVIGIMILIMIAILLGWITPTIALVLGVAIALYAKQPVGNISPQVTKLLLQAAVVGLGFGINYQTAVEVGKDGFWLSAASIITTLFLGLLMGKFLKTDKITTFLIASGTAICGGSAIAAVSPVVNAKNHHISMSLGIVFTLNAVALLIFPLLGGLFDLSQQEFGLWAAIAIHDTSSVVGASEVFGIEALKIATTVKLVRALWIFPLIFVTAFIYKSSGNKIGIPWFILLFVLAVMLNTYVPQEINNWVVLIARRLLIFTIFMVGSQLTIQQLRKLGMKTLTLGIIVWLFIGVMSFLIITY